MKRLIAISLLVLASLFTTGVAVAADRGAQANVPFAFNVGDTTFSRRGLHRSIQAGNARP